MNTIIQISLDYLIMGGIVIFLFGFAAAYFIWHDYCARCDKEHDFVVSALGKMLREKER